MKNNISYGEVMEVIVDQSLLDIYLESLYAYFY